MKTQLGLSPADLGVAGFGLLAATLYVPWESTSLVVALATWQPVATDIHDAVDAAGVVSEKS